MRVNDYKCANFQLPSSINFRYKENVPKFNVGLLALCRTPYAESFTCAQSTWQGNKPSAVPRMLKVLRVLKVLGKVKQLAKFKHRISINV